MYALCVPASSPSSRGVAVKPNLGRSFSVDGMEETYTAVFTNVYWVMFVFPAPQMKPLSVELKRKNRPPLYALWDFFPSLRLNEIMFYDPALVCSKN